MSADDDGKVSQNADNPMNHVGFDLDNLELTVVDFLNIPSPHITPYHMLDIYKKIKETAGQYDGVVITHGTDTLEETAYFLDTMAVPEIPIVLTGAMRSSNELGSDGVYNYLSALRVASDDKAADKGILVVMNDEIHAAKYVTKTHTTNVATFHTPTHGPLGIIMKHDILWFKTAEPRVRFNLEQITGLMEKGVPVVLVSRCFNGIAEPVYAYEGGGVKLQEAGVMFVKELNAPKARLKLLIALSAGLKGQELKNYIEG